MSDGLSASFPVTYIDRVYVSFVEGIHMTIRQKAVGEEGEKNKFGKGEKLVA